MAGCPGADGTPRFHSEGGIRTQPRCVLSHSPTVSLFASGWKAFNVFPCRSWQLRRKPLAILGTVCSTSTLKLLLNIPHPRTSDDDCEHSPESRRSVLRMDTQSPGRMIGVTGSCSLPRTPGCILKQAVVICRSSYCCAVQCIVEC